MAYRLNEFAQEVIFLLSVIVDTLKKFERILA